MNKILGLFTVSNAVLCFLGLISLGFTVSIARADIARDLKYQRPLLVVFQNATADGMTIDAAVTEALRASPERAGDIVTAAVLLIPALPETACPTQNEAEALHWQSLCERRIVQAALAAGADPSVVTKAAAAGRVSTFVPAATGSLRLRPETAISPLILPNSGSSFLPSGGSGGPLILPNSGSGSLPSGGSGGGGVASPS